MTPLRLRLCVASCAALAALLIISQETPTRFQPRPSPSPLSQRLPATDHSARPVDAETAAAPSAPESAAPPSPATADARAAAIRAEAVARAAAFTDWLTDWRRADSAAQPALASRGRELAAARRSAIKALIAVDPQLALELAVPVGLRPELPASIVTELERRIDRRGNVETTIGCFGPVTQLNRTALIAGEVFETFVYGRRLDQHTKFGLPLHGIAIDQQFALSEAPLRILDDAERLAAGFAIDVITVDVGGELKVLATPAELDQLTRTLVAAESREGPHVANLSSAGVNDTTTTPPTAATTPWILGAKRVLWVKVDFADDPGAVATDAEITATNTYVSDFYAANSQGKTTMAFTILPSVLRLPRDKSFYNTSSTTVSQLQSDAATLAKAYDTANGGAGTYDPERYDRWIVVFKRVPAYTFGGQAQLTGPQVRMNGNISPGTTAHELGHTQGLSHSHYWLPAGTSAVGAGAHVEYGDVFDAMGSSGSSPNNHFNAAQKAKLGYLESDAITTVTQSGTYRIARHDHADAAGARGIKIAPADASYDYWLEHRRFGPTAFNNAQFDRLRNGVLLHWGAGRTPLFTTGGGSYLVDATAGSAGGANDAPLRIGESFVDPDAGITIKPLAVGGTAPAEYIDVQVGFGAIDGNRNPLLQAELPGGALAPRTNIIFNASATDPDGDPLYFRWDFGDRTLNPSLNNITRRFSKGGSYTLRVSAHDGKGGIATKNLTFNLVDPLVSWTARTSGVTATLNDVIFGGGRFIAVGSGQIITSTDGISWTRSESTALAPYAWISAAHNGSRYVVVGLRATGTDRAGAAYSDDGLNWSVATIPNGTSQLTDLAYGAGRFVAVGDLGRVFTSVDGVTWTAADSPVTNFLRAIAFADDRFVATGDSGRVIVSGDGLNWLNRSVPTSNQLLSVARHNGAWFASSATLECFTSTDTNTWTRISTAGRTSTTTKLISTSGLLFGTAANGNVVFTEDPRSWVMHQLDATPATTMTGAAEGAGLIVAVGSRGLIYTASTPAPTPPPIAAPSLRNEADSLKVAVGKKNVLAAGGQGFTKLELYANGTKVSEINGASGALEWTPRTIGNYSLVVRGIDASGASVVSAAVPAIAGFPDWRWTNPTPLGNDLNAAVRVGDKWWVVGRAGAFITVDSNGTVTPVDFPTTQHLTYIAHHNGRFVVTGPYSDAGAKEEIGSIWTSTDGYAWTPLLTTVFDNFFANFVAYGGDRWLVGTTGGLILTSTDGLAWTRQVSGTTSSIRHAVHANNQWVAVAAGGRVLTSPDAVTWTLRTTGTTNDLWNIAYQNGTYVAVGLSGTILYSDNGVNWSRATSGTTSHLFNVTAWNGLFTAVGNSGTVVTSPDGVNWSSVSLGRFGDLFAVTGNGPEGLMVGRGGEIFVTTNGHAGWRRVTQGTNENRQAIAYGGGRFVVVGAALDQITRTTIPPIAVSTNGLTWTRAAANPAFANLSAVTYGQQRFVAVGARSNGPDGVSNTADDTAAFTSPDGTTWTARATGIDVPQLNAVAAGPALFVAAGNGGVILSSPDGATWTPRSSGVTATLRAATYGNGRFLVVGDGGTVLTSTDGATWTAASSGVTQALLTAGWWEAYGFIAAGNAGTMISSPNGTTWQQLETGVSDNLSAIANTPVGLVAAGGSNGTIIVSLDGASWSVATLPADHVIRGLAATSTAVVAVGDSGNMLAFEFADTAPAPTIVAQPVSQTVGSGATVTLTVTAQNASGAVYQWIKDGTPIVGANAPSLRIPNASSASLGNYTVLITGPTGRVTSAPATLTFGAVTDPGRLINLSIRTDLTSASDSFIFGVVVGGAGTTGSKALVVRAVGPSLGAFGVTGVLEDPRLEFFTGTVQVGGNDNWGGGEALRTVIAQVGAFPFASATSRDAAISLPSLASGSNSAKIFGTGSGTVLAELYDATPAAGFTAQTPRLVNVSVLKHLGSGVTAGFVVGGSTPRRVLIRAIGPTLGTSFGVADAVANPQLALFRGTAQISANDDWGGTSTLSSAFGRVGAFALANASRDAALVADLEPGNYTVQVGGVGGTTGTALIEIYEVPEN